MRPVTLTSLRDLDDLPFDALIDARAPCEFAEDHLPGAINLPVLDDAQRAQVGEMYVQESRFRARRLGAALVARNAAMHLETALADKPADFRPLVYCWRGGQRSNSFAMILGQIGWQVGVLEGGWKSWRRLVQTALYDAPFAAPLRVLDGNTGTAKTAILQRVAALGGQVIDLEGLARHRGSLFGLVKGDAQPTQKAFEGALAIAMARLDPSRPVIVEAESNRIGALRLPPSLWRAMQSAPRIEISAPLEARAAWLVEAYADITANAGDLKTRLQALSPYHSHEVIARWMSLAQSGAFEALACALMHEHYDPRYARTQLRQGDAEPHVLKTGRLDDNGQQDLAHQIMTWLD